MKRTPRQPRKLSESLHHQLNSYALAASGAVSVLALAPAATARIVYTPAHHVIGKGGRYHLDLNHDRMADFTLANTHSCNTDFCVDVLSALGSRGNRVEGQQGFLGIPYAFALKAGSVIGPKQLFSGMLMASSDSGQGTIGRWLNVSNGYLGLKFAINGTTHYGWARLTVKVLGGATIQAILTGYAYETIANKAIIAGRTHGPDGTLGELAAGRK